MIIRLNRDGHDESQFLPPGTPPVNPFRMQHGQVKWEGKAIKALTWLPDMLLERQQITQDHLNICLSIHRAIVSTKNALGVNNLRAYLTELLANQPLEGDEKDIFFNLLTRLNRRKSYMCFWLVCDEMNHGKIGVAVREIGFIHEALEDAHKIIDECKCQS